MNRFPRWIDCSGNEEALQNCLQLLLKPVVETQVIFLYGDPGSGLSALSHQLARRLGRGKKNVLTFPEYPAVPDAMLYDGAIEALGLPPAFGKFHAGLAPEYRLAFKLRQFDVAIINDLQSYLSLGDTRLPQTVKSIVELCVGGFAKSLVLCGTAKIYERVAPKLAAAGVNCIEVPVHRMQYGSTYVDFVGRALQNITGSGDYAEQLAFGFHQCSEGLVGRTIDYVRAHAAPQESFHKPAHASVVAWFRGFGRPVQDEIFSSWVMRNAYRPQVHCMTNNLIEECRLLVKAASDSGEGQKLDPPTLVSMLPAQLCLPTICSTFSGNFGSRSGYCNLVYCPQCILDDVANGRFPAWLSTWGHDGRCLCDKHLAPTILSVLQKTHVDPFYKGWNAFCEIANSPHLRVGRRVVSGAGSLDNLRVQEKRLCRLALRVQKWMMEKVSAGRCAELTGEAGAYLMNILLHPPSANGCPGGFARNYAESRELVHVTYVNLRTAKFRSGLQTSGPLQILIAYLLIGVAYDIIDLSESKFVQQIFRAPRQIFPIERKTIGASAMNVFTFRRQKTIQRRGRRLLSGTSYQQIEWVFASFGKY